MPHHRKLRVLVIEDDEHFRFLLLQYLHGIADLDCETEEAGTLAAVAALTARSFDIVLLDLKLPNGAGVATLQRLLDTRPVPPVVVLTGAPSEVDAIRCLATGAQGYVPKEHIHTDSLRRLILHALARWEGTKRLIVERARLLAEQMAHEEAG